MFCQEPPNIYQFNRTGVLLSRSLSYMQPKIMENQINYVGTLAFFCGICCTIFMLKLKFKATLKLSDPPNKENTQRVSSGIYRSNREEFFGYGSLQDPPKTTTPSIANVTTSTEPTPSMRPSKSTSDLHTIDISIQVVKSSSEASLNPGGTNNIVQVQNSLPSTSKEVHKQDKRVAKGEKAAEKQKNRETRKEVRAVKKDEKAAIKLQKDEVKKQEKELRKQMKQRKKEQKEQRKAEKKYLAAQKIREKLAQKQDKTTTKVEQAAQKSNTNNQEKRTESIDQSEPQPNIHVRRQEMPSTSNRVVSDVLIHDGPPPYSEVPPPVIRNEQDNTGNTSFSKPINNAVSSWDMISQHREQITRPVGPGPSTNNRKQVVMDLNYNFGNDNKNNDNEEEIENSEA
ncbi:DNA ligase 1-like [Achroia grisella]|uniref:DNA ligase 1-like n=1 Tax=Achroia grisella TaxID=688607 RepID=UPI0027D1EEF1|nr:DNA ligase 1-like [Achroia grisella]